MSSDGLLRGAQGLGETSEAMLDRLEGGGILQRNVFDRYLELSQHIAQQREAGRHPTLWTELPQRALDGTVGARVRHELGLDKTHILVASAAPVHPDLLRWLAAIGLPVLEVYGQTETCGPTTANPPEDNRIGTVGLPLPGVRLRIAEDSEILVRGGNVCKGYFRDPEATAQLIDGDGDGWLHSGDMGTLDAGGHLRITGRKKDLIITAAGQNVAPQDIEADLRNSELLSEAVDRGRKALSHGAPHPRYRGAAAMGQSAESNSNPGSDRRPGPQGGYRSHREGCQRQAVPCRTVRAFRVLDHDFAVASGELTQTHKVKRNVVVERHRKEVDEMYGGESEP